MMTLIADKTKNQTISLEEFLQLRETKPAQEYWFYRECHEIVSNNTKYKP